MDISRLLGAPVDRGDNQLQDKTEVLLGGSTDCTHTLIVKKKRRRRDKNQRDGDNSLLLNLTLDVNDLRQQVHDCIVQKSLWETRRLVAREQFHARSLQLVGHFFQLFKHGYPAVLTAVEKRFLSDFVDENIAVGGGVRGRAQFLEQWQRYKQLFSVRRLRNFSVKVATSDAGGCLVECCGAFEGRVTAAALETVFPHVLGDAALVEQLLHRPFVCPTRTLINIDARGRLVQYDAFSDVFEAMSKLLDSNPVRVVQLMADAAIGEGSLLPPVDSSIEDVRQESGNASPASSTTSRSSIDFILSDNG